MSPRIFLLSPANVSGTRARQLLSPRAGFEAARKYRTPEGVPIEEAFAFMSALYFRGKVAYARRFAVPAPETDGGSFVIAPGFGLVPFGWALHEERMQRLRKTDVDVSSRNYRRPLEEHTRLLASHLPAGAQVVLLGSVATGKYVDVLLPILGSRLVFPRCFAGIGDMSRGSLMLKAAASGVELEYAGLDAPRHRAKKGEE
jgi:hypothetical protein